MKRAIPLLLLVAALAAGCGAAGNEEGANTGAAGGTRGELFGDDDTVGAQTAAFRAGVIYCNLYPITELARQEGVAANPEAIARSYSKAETTPADQEQAYKGCLSVLKKQQK
jgi:hypothetical protein